MENTDGRHPLPSVVAKESYPLKIAKIGIQTTSVVDVNLQFKGLKFRKVIEDNVLQDIRIVLNGNDFHCETFSESNESNENETALWLVLNPDANDSCCIGRCYALARTRLIREFFLVVKKNLFDESEDIGFGDDEYVPNATPFATSVENLYKQLEASHATDDCSRRYTDEYIQHEALQVKLKPYQIKTIKWMLSRELVLEHTSVFVELKRRLIGPEDNSIKFFCDPKTYRLTTDADAVKPIPIPTGGILAEEMGMGKTIEILDLILLNPRSLDEGAAIHPSDTGTTRRPVTKADVKCFCVQTNISDTVRCTKCSKVQHRKCVNQQNSDMTPDVSYICPACWENEEPLPVKTTFIVSPQSIKMQWKTEIDKRIQTGKMSAFLYAGAKACKWVSPAKLANYDIILTDYETLRGEFDFTVRNVSSRVLRNHSITIKRKSPLLRMNFWRVCLDESQMVSNMRTKHSIIISDLSAVHRWAVTGTPIETSLDDLFGLLSFIKYSPFDRIGRWHEVVSQLDVLSNFDPIVSALQPIMRRTCKTESIMSEMDVPKQTQVVHLIDISTLNRHHYNQERFECRETFKKLMSAYHVDTRLTTLSPHALEQLMVPVRTLRRICSIPHVFDKDGNTIVMRPHQMLQHLINTNISSSKLELARIFSILRSLVALGTGNHKNRQRVATKASQMCENLLKWSKDFQNEPTMNESLLQIQTTHLMALVTTQNSSSNADLKSMEQNFYSSQLNAIVNFKAETQKNIAKLNDFEAYFRSHCFEWASEILTNQTSDQLICQIRNRTTAAYENVGNIVSANSTVLHTLSKWSHFLLSQRKIFQRSFAALDSLVDSLESLGKEQQSTEVFAILSNEAAKCHWNESYQDSLEGLFNDTESDEPPTKRARLNDSGSIGLSPPEKPRNECTLCSITKQLERYGAFISDNSHKATNKTGRGGENINPAFQEFVLKVMLQSNEYLGNINTKVGIDLLTALENFRFEFHQYKNLLTSIKKNVDNFHRVQKRNTPKPTTTCDSVHIWMGGIEWSKQDYGRLVRVKRYLDSLKENFEIDDCSICMKSVMEYDVFECGHQCCPDCFVKLPSNNSIQFECPFCRQVQYVHSTHQFTIDKSEKFTDSSIKIEHIVREVHKLKKSDPNVKILLFSQWADVLHTLKDELLSNDIASRSVVSTTKSLQRIVEEFKDPRKNITCLLLPYKCGSKGLNLIEATHVFLVEPIINRGEELQTLGRVHRISQTKETVVHRFVTKNTIEETIYKVMTTEAGILSSEKCTIKTLMDLFADTDSEASTA